jgi:uncharacterized protein (TIGR02246 family)
MSRPASDSEFRSAIESAIGKFERAANMKDVVAISNLYTEDATLLPPGSPQIKGRANILAFWESFLDAGASDVAVRVVDVRSSGEMAYEIGEFKMNLPGSNGSTAPTEGKYMVVWKRQPDGSIKMVADIFNITL